MFLTNQTIFQTLIIFKISRNINLNIIKASFFLIISYIIIFTEIIIVCSTILYFKNDIIWFIHLIVLYIY